MAGASQAFSPEAGDLIAPERKGRTAHFRTLFEPGEIIDAEFENVFDGRSASGQASFRQPPPLDTGKSRRSLFERRTSALVTSIDAMRRGVFPAAVVTLCAASFWVFGGHAVLARLASRDEGAAALEIADVSTHIGVIGGLRVVIVNGTVRNATDGMLVVPAIGVTSGRSGRPVTVKALARTLGAGETTGFRARLPIGEGDLPKVDVAFLPAMAGN